MQYESLDMMPFPSKEELLTVLDQARLTRIRSSPSCDGESIALTSVQESLCAMPQARPIIARIGIRA